MSRGTIWCNVFRQMTDLMALQQSPESWIGWIGTGVMGVSMCGHLIRQGFAATVYNRTRCKADPLLDQGAAWADSPADVAEQSDVVFTIVGFPDDVRQVILGPDGVSGRLRAGQADRGHDDQ